MNDIFITYPGGKNGSGTYQKLINLMPPHRIYIEPFLGGGALMRAKKPASINIGIDINEAVIKEWELNRPAEIPNLTLISIDALTWLHWHGQELGKNCLIYCDPPYLMSTRTNHRQIYEFELAEVNEHKKLLSIIKNLKCLVMISGYWSSLYANELKGWNNYQFDSMTRRGLAREWVWFNYEDPVELHDYRYLGENFREREKIKRKKARWIERLSKMPVLERRSMFMAIEELASKRALPGDAALPADYSKNKN